MEGFDEIPEDSFIILDTSGIHTDVNIDIINSLRNSYGFDSLSVHDINNENNSLNNVLSLGKELIVISEVQSELRLYLKKLNSQLNFKRSNINECIEPNMLKSGKLDEPIKKDYRKLEKLQKYADSVSLFLDNIKRKDPVGSLDKFKTRIFNNYLEVARGLSYLTRRNYPDKLTLGAKLETDKKLIAAAYTFSHKFPATILTMDKGLIGLSSDVGVMDEVREYSPGKNEIYVLNTSNLSEGIYRIWPDYDRKKDIKMSLEDRVIS